MWRSSSNGVPTTRMTADSRLDSARRAGVIGSPIGHSLSPVLHRAAYAALGLPDWEYEPVEVGAGEVASFVAALDDSWAGLSVTMPGKVEALASADAATDRARLSGAANTLVRTTAGWLADNTDIDGITKALAAAGCVQARTGWLLGSGATARSALIALSDMGVKKVYVQVRSQPREQTMALAGALGVEVVVSRLSDPGPPLHEIDVGLSTVPAGTAPVAESVGAATHVVVMDAAYYPRDSQWAAGLEAHGGRRVDGAQMLLHQAGVQVELMTGKPAPLEAMQRALSGAIDGVGPRR